MFEHENGSKPSLRSVITTSNCDWGDPPVYCKVIVTSAPAATGWGEMVNDSIWGEGGVSECEAPTDVGAPVVAWMAALVVGVAPAPGVPTPTNVAIAGRATITMATASGPKRPQRFRGEANGDRLSMEPPTVAHLARPTAQHRSA